MAVTPQGGAHLEGKTSYKKQGGIATNVSLRVASRGRQVAKFRFPPCGSWNTGPVLKKLKISAAGNFSAKRNVREVHERARGGGVGNFDVVIDWKVSVKGKFTAPTKAQGTFSVSERDFLRDSETGEIRDEPGIPQYGFCKTGKTTWRAKKQAH